MGQMERKMLIQIRCNPVVEVQDMGLLADVTVVSLVKCRHDPLRETGSGE